MDGHREQELYAAVRMARDEYTTVNAEYDELLSQAHRFQHGSTAMVGALTQANALAPQMQDALSRYFEAVKELTEFYRSSHASDRSE